MADESIGQVSVNIVGDYSGLEKSFTESQSLAQQAGQAISASLESGAAGSDKLTASAELTDEGIQNLFADGMKLAEQWSQFSVTSEQAAAGLTAMGGASADSAAKLDGLGDTFKRVRNDVEAFEKAWGEAITENLKRSEAEFEKFASDVGNFISNPLRAAGEAAKDFLITVGPIGAVALAASAALAAVGAELISLVSDFGQAAQATQNMADRLNISWTETRRLEEEATIAGVSLTSLQAASFRLAETFDEGSKQGQKISATLQSIAVSGNTSGELLTGLLQKLSQIPDATTRIDLAYRVLGRSSQQLIPLIKNHDDLLRAVQTLGPAIGEGMAADLQKSNAAIKEMNISWDRFKEEIAAGAAPAVTQFITAVRGLIVETSKLTIETAGSAKALIGMIPSGLLATLADLASAIIKIQLLFNPFAAAIKVGIAALEEFNIVAGAVSGKTTEGLIGATEKLGTSLRTKLAADLHNVTTGTKEFIDAFKTAGGGVAAVIDSIIASQQKLSGNVRDAKAAYDQLNQAFKDGTTVANGHKVTIEDVARALSNLKAAEAAAATTKADHTEKTKALTHAMLPLSDSVEGFTSSINRSRSAHKALVDEASKLTDVIVRYVSAVEMAAIKQGALDTAMRIANVGFEEGSGYMVTYMQNAEKIAPLMEDLANRIDDAAKSALNTDPYEKLGAALETLGIKGSAYFERIRDKADEAYNVILDSGVATYNELAQAALKAAQAEIDAAVNAGEMTRAEADKTLAQIQSDLDQLDASTVDSATKRGRTEKTLGEDIQAINKRTFDSLEKGLATAIVQMKGFSDVWKTLWQKLAEDVLNIMFKVLLDPLEKGISKTLGSIFSGSGGGGSGGGGSATGILSAVGGGGGSASSEGGAASAVAGQAASMAVSSVVGMVTGAITAISSVVGNFQMAHMSADLQKIEESTRYLKIGLVTQSDGLLTTSHQTLDAINQVVGEMKGIVGINLQGTISQDASNKLLDDLVNSGQNLYVVAARTLTEIRDSIRGGDELLMGQLYLIAKGVNPSIGQRLLNSAIGGIASNISGAVGGIGSLLGGIGGLFGGGGGNSSDSGKIETNTRMLAIGLVTQGDSLLNDSHTIRNILSDISKWNSDVLQTYLQNINIDLDKLTNMGGVYSSASTSQIAAYSAQSASASAGTTINVDMTGANISSDVTDSKVRDIFNRGIRMSKLAGALPAGRFPQ